MRERSRVFSTWDMPNEMTRAAPAATFTIQPMAASCGLSEYTLRSYEKIGRMRADSP